MNDSVSELVSPPYAGSEAETLIGFLDYQRAVLARKVAGLTTEQLAQRLEPSTMTLGGLLAHMAYVEDWWFTQVFDGNETHEPWASADWEADEDWDWHAAADRSPQELVALWEAEVTVSRRITAEAAVDGLDALSVRHSHSRPDQRFSLRWVLVHMVEEYARHLGHADLLRETIDGAVGD